MHRPPARRGGRRVDLHAHTLFSDGAAHARGAGGARRRARAGSRSPSPTTTRSRACRARRAAARAGARAGAGHRGLVARGTAPTCTSSATTSIPTTPGCATRWRASARSGCERALAMVERLRALGAPVDFDEVLERARPGRGGPPARGRGADARGPRRDAGRGVPALPRRAGRGVRAAARVPPRRGHRADPRGRRRERAGASGRRASDRLVEQLAGQGLRGIEVWHPQHGPATVRRYRALARRLGLLETGGSDFHGPGARRDARRAAGAGAACSARLKQAGRRRRLTRPGPRR